MRELKHRVALNYSVKIARNVRSLTLWTERGAARHAKMLETDQAWAFFEKLEDSYFRQKNSNRLQSPKHYQKPYAWLPNWLNKSSFWNRKPTS